MKYAVVVPSQVYEDWEKAIMAVVELVLEGRDGIAVYTANPGRDAHAILGTLLGKTPDDMERAFATGEGLLDWLQGAINLSKQVTVFPPLEGPDDPAFN